MSLTTNAHVADLNLTNKIELKTGKWNLSDLKTIPKNGLKVFSCFHCGGGSTMGYKLAGYEVFGGVEIDKEMMSIYRENHKPKYSYLMGVQEFKNIPNDQLPEELFNLDILDGSPPCSSFSMAGAREKKWGKNTHFREGQSKQVLDDLFFHYIDIAKKLQPKVVVAENVKGLIQGNAKGYVKEIFAAFKDAGYSCQLFLLNASAMGVPQKRERTFFIANNLGKKLKLNFNEPTISVKKAWEQMPKQTARPLTENAKKHWLKMKPGQTISEVNNGSGFNNWKIPYENPAPTIAASGWNMHPIEPRHLSNLEHLRLQTFPDDYFYGTIGARYLCGMSVPPFMMSRIANQIALQLFNK